MATGAPCGRVIRRFAHPWNTRTAGRSEIGRAFSKSSLSVIRVCALGCAALLIARIYVGERAEAGNKPGSVWGNHSSGTAVTGRLLQPTREPVRIRRIAPLLGDNAPLFGLAPGGVYRAANRYRSRGALLPHHFTLTGQGPAVYFLWHFPWACAPQALPGALSEGARTFLWSELQRLPGRLRLSQAAHST